MHNYAHAFGSCFLHSIIHIHIYIFTHAHLKKKAKIHAHRDRDRDRDRDKHTHTHLNFEVAVYAHGKHELQSRDECPEEEEHEKLSVVETCGLGFRVQG
jgi:hypothetical protein